MLASRIISIASSRGGFFMRKFNRPALATIAAALLVLVAWSGGAARAQAPMRTAAAINIFPVPVPSHRDASTVRTADDGCACHQTCIRILHTCEGMNGEHCFRDEQKCWMVCNKNYPECRKD
jgi:hypothetical protein